MVGVARRAIVWVAVILSESCPGGNCTRSESSWEQFGSNYSVEQLSRDAGGGGLRCHRNFISSFHLHGLHAGCSFLAFPIAAETYSSFSCLVFKYHLCSLFSIIYLQNIVDLFFVFFDRLHIKSKIWWNQIFCFIFLFSFCFIFFLAFVLLSWT